MYVLNLDKNNRVLSIGVYLKATEDDLENITEEVTTDEILTEKMPDLSDNKWTNDYIYNITTDTYIYDPVERPPEPPEPTDRLGQLEADVMYLSMMTGIDIPTSEV